MKRSECTNHPFVLASVLRVLRGLFFVLMSVFFQTETIALAQEKSAQGTSPWFVTQERKEKPNALRGRDLQKNAVLGPSRRALRESKQKTKESPGDFSVGYESERTLWKSGPDGARSDGESFGIHEQYRVGAYTNVRDGDAFDFRLGPEVIVKDTKESQPLETRSEQPDQELGVGMRLKYKF
ncbi:MAG: hypothetical protein IJU76_09135 [Desulfovibrionaceae bacterium]|nr:hypothetical protein [Desulfovibrionaceae bacterium]